MKNLKALIKKLEAHVIDPEVIEMDLADMYAQDANDATVAYNFIVESNGANIPTAAMFISNLDTSIREGIVLAIAADKGNDWVLNNLGFEVYA